ncbi:MAG: hypothetical protein IJY09_05015 [Lachnospiraceae bacterium]|nr:hypothetical protein [Lachnospiraceae bacterium]
MLLLKILGFLLKLIGILLLSLLGLFLVMLLIVLFVPVRYRAKITRQGSELTVKARVGWLGPIIRVPVVYQDGKLSYGVKLLFFQVFPRNKKESVEESAESGTSDTIEGGAEEKTEATPAQVLEQSEAQSTDTTSEEVLSEQTEENDALPEGVQQEETEPEEEPQGAVARLCWKIQKLLDKVKALYQKLVDKVCGIRDKIRQKVTATKEKITGLRTRILDVCAFLQADSTRLALRLTGKSIFQLIKYMLPYKIKGEVIFGTGDPYSMGQILSVLGICYGLYARTLNITADFEATEFRLDAQVELKGRIRMVRVLYILVKLWFKGNLRKVITDAKGLV